MSVRQIAPTKDGRSWILKVKYKTIFGEAKDYTSKRYKTKK